MDFVTRFVCSFPKNIGSPRRPFNFPSVLRAMSVISERVVNTDRQSSFVFVADRKGLWSSYRKQLTRHPFGSIKADKCEDAYGTLKIADLTIFEGSNHHRSIFSASLSLFSLSPCFSLSFQYRKNDKRAGRLIGKPTRGLKISWSRPFLSQRQRRWRLTEITATGECGCTLSIDVIGYSLEINGR